VPRFDAGDEEGHRVYDVHMPDALQIGELAERTGVSVDTIRHYERLALLPKAARTSAGYRQYPPSAVDRVRLVRYALRFGFSLRDVAGFLRVREAGGTPCRDVRAAADRLLTAVDQRISDLTAARKDMSRTLRNWDRRLAGTPANRPARLLESLETDVNDLPVRSPLSNLKTRR
jgi:DNA-binding transcriptional MerR regulator